jgi:GNAT superfamily N-acetyltransferase
MKLNQLQMKAFVSTVLEARPDLQEREPGGFAKINAEFLTETWASLMEAGPGVAYGEEYENKPVGFLIGSHSPDAMTGVFTAWEYLWVRAHDAPKGTGLKLLQEFEEAAKQAGCKQVVIGCNSVYKHEALAYYYAQIGFRLCSQSFQKWI